MKSFLFFGKIKTLYKLISKTRPSSEMKGVFSFKNFWNIYLNMKYIISESRLESLITNYLNDSLNNIESHTQEIEGEEYTWWGTKEEPVFVLKNVYGKIGIAFDTQYISSLSNLFNISEHESKTYLLKWINTNMDIHPDFQIQQNLF